MSIRSVLIEMINDFTDNSGVIYMYGDNNGVVTIKVEEYVDEIMDDMRSQSRFFYIISRDSVSNSYLAGEKNYSYKEDSICFTGYMKDKNKTYKLSDHLVIDSRNIDKLVRNYKLKKLDV